MRVWECQDCGAKITTRLSSPEFCDCGNTKSFKLIEKKDKCEMCGNEDQRTIMVHHIVPKAFQGDNSEDNLMILCANCHKIVHNEMKEKVKEWALVKAKFRENYPKPKMPESINKYYYSVRTPQMNVLLYVIKMLEKKFGKPVPEEEIIKSAKEQNISEEEALELIRRLKINGSIFEPRKNFIETII